MKKVIFVALIGWLILFANNAFANGALAIDSSQGSQYGFAYNYQSMSQAEERALRECGDRCRIVLRFSTGCAAYAVDQSSGSSIYGWGTGSSNNAAQTRALSECQSQGGNFCSLRVWGCNSR